MGGHIMTPFDGTVAYKNRKDIILEIDRIRVAGNTCVECGVYTTCSTRIDG